MDHTSEVAFGEGMPDNSGAARRFDFGDRWRQ